MNLAAVSLTCGGSDSIRVATVNLDTGELTNVSPPCPPMNSFDASNQGTGLDDGRYVFGSMIEISDPGPLLKLYILDAARTTWTTVETDVELDSFDTEEGDLLDVGNNEVMVFYRSLTNHKRTLKVDLTTGLSRSYEDWGGPNVDNEAKLFESPSKGPADMVFATTESEYIYRFPSDTGVPPEIGGVWVDTGDRFPGPDIDLTAAAYHPDRQSVVVWGVAGVGAFPGRPHYVREFSYPAGVMVNSWGPFYDEPASFAANGVIVGDYYAIADAHELFFSVGELGVFRFSTGALTTLPVVLPPDLLPLAPAVQVLMIQNAHINMVPTPGVMRRVAQRDRVRFEGH